MTKRDPTYKTVPRLQVSENILSANKLSDYKLVKEANHLMQDKRTSNSTASKGRKLHNERFTVTSSITSMEQSFRMHTPFFARSRILPGVPTSKWTG